MIVENSFISHVGCWRNENQDFYMVCEKNNIFAVADGMGGLSEGSKASRLACKAFNYQAEKNNLNLNKYFEEAHDLVLKFCEQKGMPINTVGTTGIVVHVDAIRKEFNVCWCGDSRLYYFCDLTKKLEQITVDHSYVQSLVDKGIITPEQAETHKDKNVITSAIGIGLVHQLKIGSRKRKLSENDILILCSDGLSNEVSLKRMEEFCLSANCSQELSELLLTEALNNGGHDNITIGVIKLKEEIF